MKIACAALPGRRERLFRSALGACDRLGLYKALAATGPSTSAELASEAGVNERYAREWLEQPLTGILEAVDPNATDAERRYADARRGSGGRTATPT